MAARSFVASTNWSHAALKGLHELFSEEEPSGAIKLGKGSPLISALGVVDVFVEVSRAYAPGI
jgi:hypothetical protein